MKRNYSNKRKIRFWSSEEVRKQNANLKEREEIKCM
jgi:hypothetical protein